jgi:hypothetical protein
MSMARIPALVRGAAPLAVLALMAACDRGADTASAAATSAAAAAVRDAGEAASPAASSTTTVRTAARPADVCGWIPAAEVAAIVGPLEGTPRATPDGCVYPLPLDSATARRRALAVEVRRKLEEKFGKSDIPMMQPVESAVIVDVQVYADPSGARAAAAGMAHMVQQLGIDSAATARAAASTPPPPLPGWDWTNPPARRSFSGQLGHLTVRVTAHAEQVTREQSAAIGTRVRDRIPDLPFASQRPAGSAGPDPCVLLTAQEAEAVLGPLIVPPYRSDEHTPLAMGQGKSCTYFTTGHHGLVLTPTWEYGESSMKAIRGIGGLLEGVAPGLHNDAADTLDTGPWDDAGGDPGTGQLYFLKGDRLLELGYLVSSTDMDGAVRLAQIAVGRL